MSWTFDSGTIYEQTVVDPTTVTSPYLFQSILVDPGAAATGTPAIEKIDSVRIQVSFIILGVPNDFNTWAIGVDGLTPKPFTGQPGGNPFIPELYARGNGIDYGPNSIDETLTATQLGQFRSVQPGLVTDFLLNGVTGCSPEKWASPKLVIHITAGVPLTVTVTRVQFTITSTYVGIDPNDNDGSARESALSGYVR